MTLLQEKENRQLKSPLKYAKEHDKQKEATVSDKVIRALFWGNRVGKTEWGAMETARYLQNEHPYKTIDSPIEIWSACPSYELQEETTQLKLLRYLSPDKIEKTETLRGGILKKIKMKNGNILSFKSYEQGREKFQGVGKRLIWFDEEPPSDIWEECFVRQEAGIQLDIILTMTPINGMTWVYDDIYMDTSNPRLFVSEASWEDNPFLTEDQKNQMRSGLKSEESVAVREHGKFVARVGLVCSWWRREKHMRSYDSLDPSWSWFEVFDGGWTDPATWLLIGIDGIGNIHIVDGFSENELITEEIANKRNIKTTDLMMRGGVSDSDNPRLVKELSSYGMKLRPIEKLPGEHKSWDEAMAEAMAGYGKIQKGTGEPMMFINNTLTWLIQQIENLKWLEQKKKEGREIKPVWNDHRRFKHHWDGVYCIAYFCVDYTRPKENENKKVVKHNKEVKSKWQIR